MPTNSPGPPIFVNPYTQICTSFREAQPAKVACGDYSELLTRALSVRMSG